MKFYDEIDNPFKNDTNTDLLEHRKEFIAKKWFDLSVF